MLSAICMHGRISKNGSFCTSVIPSTAIHIINKLTVMTTAIAQDTLQYSWPCTERCTHTTTHCELHGTSRGLSHLISGSLQWIWMALAIKTGGCRWPWSSSCDWWSRKWDGRGSPPGAVGKSGTPLPSILLTDLQTDLLTDLSVLCVVYVHVCVLPSLGSLESSPPD